jgi:hypothetical protein
MLEVLFDSMSVEENGSRSKQGRGSREVQRLAVLELEEPYRTADTE